MTEIYTLEYFKENLEVPNELIPFVLAAPRILPGETDDDYFRLFEMMTTEILPDTDLEWLYTIDLSWLWFEIQRYRRWKNAIILTNRSAALEIALAKTNPAALQIGVTSVILAQARLEAHTLLTNPNDRALNAQLRGNGYDPDSINADAFVHGALPLTTIERFLTSARKQAAVLLRDVTLHRQFARRAQEAQSRFLDERRAIELESKAQANEEAQPSDLR